MKSVRAPYRALLVVAIIASSAAAQEERRPAPKVQLQRKPPAPGGAAPAAIEIRPPAAAAAAVPTTVDQAIERGVGYLRGQPWADASHAAGYTALAGLTLLECGAKSDDPLVQRAAQFVRGQAAGQSKTYEISLIVLFLDRLGQTEDHRLIQGLGLRLLAGQNAAGGWWYDCPVLPASDMAQLYKFLRSHRPVTLQKPLQARQALPIPLKAGNDPFRQFGTIVQTKGIESSRPSEAIQPARVAVAARPAPLRLQALPPHLRQLPIVLLQDETKTGLLPGRDDNSNTQFALLALWAARRHDVPVEQALLHAERRFRASQYQDGRWSYHLQGGHPSVAMTAVGLLGLAMGHGAAAARMDEKAARDNPRDAVLHKGLDYLGQHIGVADDRPTLLTPLPNLYFLWSVERVGMLFDLKTIGGRDWYRWGAPLLVVHQRPDGSWRDGHYPGSTPHVDTCLALLFLKRSNLVQDLTDRLRLYMPIRDTDSAGR